ncbi:MAG: hypothetical protein ABI759_11545 [Candidatus Solibacter sp.]
MTTWKLQRAWPVLAATAALCLLAYARALTLPLISDDYLQVQLGRDYGPAGSWHNLASDALYRCRATSILITYWTERLFGVGPLVLNISSLILHVFNTWLVLALGYWRLVGWRVSCVAACFFAIYEGHQEAVMWYAALPELLVFLFAVASFLCWIAWLQERGRRELYYAGALVLYIFALLSKESGVVVGPLMVLAALAEGRRVREWWWRTVPFAALAILNFAMIYAARSNHLHFNDGTFSIHGPFWIVVPVSVGRLLWIWGMLSLAALAWWREARWMRMLWVAAGWIVITLLPYSFLTYMPRVPSRHVYFASAGLALIVAAALLTFRERFHAKPWAVGALATVLVAHQVLYLFVRKQRQFMERAAPTEQLLVLAGTQSGTLFIDCFPYSVLTAELAVRMTYGGRVRVVLDPVEAERTNARHINLCVAQPAAAPQVASAGTGNGPQ